MGQDPSQSDLSGCGVVLLANLLQTICKLEDVGEIFLRVPRDVLTEIVVVEVVRRFLETYQRNVLPLLKDTWFT